jgi:tryptophanyl-tRNA synthetase
MSKTRNNAIGLFDPAKRIEKKLKGAFTDEKKLRQGDPGRPEICNVFTIHRAVTPSETVERIERECQSGALGCGECKQVCAESIQRELDPIRERAEELNRDRAEVLRVLARGAERARSVAQGTLTEVRRRMGLTTRSMR